MGYVSDKQLQADYLEVIRKFRERDRHDNERAKMRRERLLDAVIVLIVVIIWYVASRYS